MLHFIKCVTMLHNDGKLLNLILQQLGSTIFLPLQKILLHGGVIDSKIVAPQEIVVFFTFSNMVLVNLGSAN